MILRHHNLSYRMSKKLKLLSVSRQKIEVIIFFVIFYLYLWLVVDLRLIPNVGGIITNFPVFYCRWNFFSDTCVLPGGPVDYISYFLVQFFYISWAGAIIVTLQAWLIYYFNVKFLDSLKMSKFYYVSFVSPIIILGLCNKYMYFFNIASGLLVALVFVNLYTLLAKEKKESLSLLVFMILSILLYPIAGASLLLFAILCMTHELIGRSRKVVPMAELVIALAVTFVGGVYIYDIGILEAFTRLLPIHSDFKFINNTKYTLIACILYLFLPLISSLFWLIQKIPYPDFRRSNRIDRAYQTINQKTLFYHSLARFLIMLILASLALYFTYDRTNKNVYTADYYANHRNWSKALEIADGEIKCPFILFIVNRALYNKGRFAQDMFLYPQQVSAPFYGTNAPQKYFKGLYQGIDLCLDLGLINHAEHSSWQKIEEFGPLPEFLKRLAIIKMVKGNMNAARVYLNTLSKTIFHTDWSKQYLAKLDADPTLSSDEYIQHFRSIMLKSDHLLGRGVDLWALTRLLEDNRKNKMAFEYLMAMCLLNKHPESIVKNLHRLPDFDYKETPQTYEEAYFLCLLWGSKGKFPKWVQISEKSKKRFDAFDQFMRRHAEDRQAVINEMTTTFRNTYYEYCYYGYKNNLGSKGGKK